MWALREFEVRLVMINLKTTIISIILLSFVGFVHASAAYALSCAAPVLNETVLENAQVVFEGTSENVRDLTRQERKTLISKKIAAKGGSVESLKVFDLVVVKGWKGVKEGERVQVVRNTYWGDTFTEGEQYFILSAQKIDDLYITHLCDHTMNSKHIEDYGFLEMLEEVYVKE